LPQVLQHGRAGAAFGITLLTDLEQARVVDMVEDRAADAAAHGFGTIKNDSACRDQVWLRKATKEISKYWRNKCDRRQGPAPSLHPDSPKSNTLLAEKVSHNSSPKVTPDGQFGVGNGAMPSPSSSVRKVISQFFQNCFYKSLI
jgi:hypothetical protein